MSTKPSKRIAAGAAGLAIAAAMVLPGVASAAGSSGSNSTPDCMLTPQGGLAVCAVQQQSSSTSGLAGSLGQIPLIGPLLASLFAS